MIRKRLLKDIVIPKGTIFYKAPGNTIRTGDGHISHLFGLTKDTTGEVTYLIDPADTKLNEYFEDISVSKKC